MFKQQTGIILYPNESLKNCLAKTMCLLEIKDGGSFGATIKINDLDRLSLRDMKRKSQLRKLLSRVSFECYNEMDDL